MTERYDIEITDQISPAIPKKLKEIAANARDGASAVKQLNTTLAGLNTASFDRLAAASAKVTNAQARQTSATARLTNAQASSDVKMARAAVANQRLATEAAKTAAQEARLGRELQRNALLATQQEAANIRLANSKARVAAAAAKEASGENETNRVRQAGTAITRQAQYRLLNLSYQLQDVGVSLASGQSPFTVLVQQGAQVAGIYGASGGLRKGLAQLKTDFLGLVPPAALASIAAVGVGIGLMTREIRKSTGVAVSFGDVTKGIFQALGQQIMEGIKPQIEGIGITFNTVVRIIAEAGKILYTALTAPFVFSYKTIVTLFANLPQALGDLFVAGVNIAIEAVEMLLNGAIAGVNGLNALLNTALKKLGKDGDTFGVFKLVDIPKAKNEFKGLQGLLTGMTDAVTSALDPERADDFFAKVEKNAVANYNARQKKKKEGHKKTFDDIVKEYEAEIAGAKAVGLERERILGIQKAEEQLKRPLTAKETPILTGLVDKLETQKVVNEVNQPLIDLAATLPLLDAAYAKGAITLDQYTTKTLDLRIAAAELGRDMNSGLLSGVLRVKQEFTNIAAVAGNAVVNAFQSAEDALVEFVKTGKLDFASLIDSMIADLARLAIRQQITAPLAGLLGGAATGGSTFGQFFNSFAVGTDRVRGDQLAKIHDDEIIVPAREARQIRAGKASLGGSAGGGVMSNSVVNSIAVTVQGSSGNAALDGARAGEAIKDSLDVYMSKFLRQQSRRGGALNSGNTMA